MIASFDTTHLSLVARQIYQPNVCPYFMIGCPSRYTWDTGKTARRAGDTSGGAAPGRDPLLQELLGHHVQLLQVALVQGVLRTVRWYLREGRAYLVYTATMNSGLTSVLPRFSSLIFDLRKLRWSLRVLWGVKMHLRNLWGSDSSVFSWTLSPLSGLSLLLLLQ